MEGPQVGSGQRPELGVSPRVGKQAEAQPEAALGTWEGGKGCRIINGPLPALLLTSPGGHGILTGEPDNGLGGQHLSVYGHGAVLPGLPGPHQTAKHNGSLRQADNPALSGWGSRAGSPCPSVSFWLL